MIARIYAAGARYRRRFYTEHPERQRRLSRPVISIGNLAVGGRSTTPLVAAIASRLLAMGERPAVLSRGYARRRPTDGVVVVREPDRITADVDRAGDEPLMLARQLDGVAVLSCSDRYLAGRLAEHHFGTTVHVLDDGFQHFQLYRDIDVVAVAKEDLDDPRTLPAGRLREAFDAIAGAHAIIALDEESMRLAGQLPTWRAFRQLGSPHVIEPLERGPGIGDRPAVAVAGIARPQSFFSDLRAAGWRLAAQLAFADHHAYSRRDLDRVLGAVRHHAGSVIVTTEKDLVRLLPFRPFPVAVASVPLITTIEPSATFDEWLLGSVQRAHGERR